MGILAPLALFFSLIAPVIVAMYLLKIRRLDRRISSTFLWHQALRDVEANVPWQRLRVSLLLVLQLLVLIALILALARPYLLSAGGVTGDIVVLLDASASMKARDVVPDRFSAAKQTIDGLIDQLRNDQAMTLVTMAHVPQVLIAQTRDKGALREALTGAKPTNQSGDLSAALSLAAAMARNGQELSVVVVSDGNTEPGMGKMDLPFTLKYQRVGSLDSPPENVAIAAFATRRLGNSLAAMARVVNYGERERTVTIELSADRHVIDVKRFQLRAGEQQLVNWPALSQTARFMEARLAEDDNLDVDNVAWAVCAGSGRIRVLLATAGNIFLEKALNLIPGIELYKTTPQGFASGDYDLYILDGFWPQGLSNGHLLVVNPPENVPFVGVGDQTKITRVEPSPQRGNLLEYVDIREVHVAQARKLVLPSWAREVVVSPETPLIALGEKEGKRIAVFGFDLHESDLALQPAFPILIHNLMSWFVPESTGVSIDAKPGEPVQVAALATAEEVTILRPDGGRIRLGPPFPFPPYSETDWLGLYEVLQQGSEGTTGRFQRSGFFSVNLFSPLESKLAPAVVLPVEGSSAEPLTEREEAISEFWIWATLAAFGLLAMEWWVYQRGH